MPSSKEQPTEVHHVGGPRMTHGGLATDDVPRAAISEQHAPNADQRPNCRPATNHGPTTADHGPTTADTEAVAEGPVAGSIAGDALGRAGNSPTQPTGDQPTKPTRINNHQTVYNGCLLLGVQQAYGVGSPSVFGRCTASVVQGVRIDGVGGPRCDIRQVYSRCTAVYGGQQLGVRQVCTAVYGGSSRWCTAGNSVRRATVSGVRQVCTAVYGRCACRCPLLLVMYPCWLRRLVSGWLWLAIDGSPWPTGQGEPSLLPVKGPSATGSDGAVLLAENSTWPVLVGLRRSLGPRTSGTRYLR